VAVVFAVVGVCAGGAGAVELLSGGTGSDIQEAAAKGAAMGFLFGVLAALCAAGYLLLSGS
jgi:hypothetical protein